MHTFVALVCTKYAILNQIMNEINQLLYLLVDFYLNVIQCNDVL